MKKRVFLTGHGAKFVRLLTISSTGIARIDNKEYRVTRDAIVDVDPNRNWTYYSMEPYEYVQEARKVSLYTLLALRRKVGKDVAKIIAKFVFATRWDSCWERIRPLVKKVKIDILRDKHRTRCIATVFKRERDRTLLEYGNREDHLRYEWFNHDEPRLVGKFDPHIWPNPTWEINIDETCVCAFWFLAQKIGKKLAGRIVVIYLYPSRKEKVWLNLFK